MTTNPVTFDDVQRALLARVEAHIASTSETPPPETVATAALRIEHTGAVWTLPRPARHHVLIQAKRAQIRELARALRVLKTSPEFITEVSVRALLAQQRWTLARKRADESAEFWQSPRGTDTVLFPLRPDFIDYRRCLVAVVRDVYEDAREARRRRNMDR